MSNTNKFNSPIKHLFNVIIGYMAKNNLDNINAIYLDDLSTGTTNAFKYINDEKNNKMVSPNNDKDLKIRQLIQNALADKQVWSLTGDINNYITYKYNLVYADYCSCSNEESINAFKKYVNDINFDEPYIYALTFNTRSRYEKYENTYKEYLHIAGESKHKFKSSLIAYYNKKSNSNMYIMIFLFNIKNIGNLVIHYCNSISADKREELEKFKSENNVNMNIKADYGEVSTITSLLSHFNIGISYSELYDIIDKIYPNSENEEQNIEEQNNNQNHNNTSSKRKRKLPKRYRDDSESDEESENNEESNSDEEVDEESESDEESNEETDKIKKCELHGVIKTINGKIKFPEGCKKQCPGYKKCHNCGETNCRSDRCKNLKRKINKEQIPKNSDEMFSLGLDYYKKKDYNQMKKYYLQAVEKGHSRAMFNLGLYYEEIEKNPSKMKKYYGLAIKKGHSGAMFNLGVYYEIDEENPIIAEKYYEMERNKEKNNFINLT